jgi:hypothetical protein
MRIFPGTPCTAYSVEEGKGVQNWLNEHISLEQRTSYYYRSLGEWSDSDLYSYWHLRGRDLFDRRLDFTFSGKHHVDLDEQENLWSDNFLGSGDTSIYQVYADVHDKDRRFGARFGRQYILEADGLQLDGVLFRLFEKKSTNFGLFYGWPVRYDLEPADDWAAGFSVSTSPWKGNRSRLTYVHYSGDNENLDDDYFLLQTWQRFNQSFQGFGRMTVLNGKYQMSSLYLNYFRKPGNLHLSLQFHNWAGLEDRGTFYYSPLYSIYGGLNPYTYVAARGVWSVLPWLSISPGLAYRRVSGINGGTFDRQYLNSDLTFIMTPFNHWTFSLSGQYWDVSQGDRFFGITGEVIYNPGGKWKATLGTGYLNYTYTRYLYPGFSASSGDITISSDGVVTQISPDVYSLYGRLDYKINRRLGLRFGAVWENHRFEDENGYQFRTQLIVRF